MSDLPLDIANNGGAHVSEALCPLPFCVSPVGWQTGDEFVGRKLYLSSDLTYFAYTPSISPLHLGNFH